MFISREEITNRQRVAIEGANAIATIIDVDGASTDADIDLLIRKCYTWATALRSLAVRAPGVSPMAPPTAMPAAMVPPGDRARAEMGRMANSLRRYATEQVTTPTRSTTSLASLPSPPRTRICLKTRKVTTSGCVLAFAKTRREETRREDDVVAIDVPLPPSPNSTQQPVRRQMRAPPHA